MAGGRFVALHVAEDMWLVTNAGDGDADLMDARFTGSRTRDRAYAYMDWLNEGQDINQKIDALRTELDHAIDDLRNLRAQLLPAVR